MMKIFKSYLLLISGFFVCGFHITLVGTHVPKYVIDRGLDDWTAAMILSLIGFFNIFGSLLSGYLSTKISKKNRILKIIEKPKKYLSNLAITGLYFFDNNVVKYSKANKVCRKYQFL